MRENKAEQKSAVFDVEEISAKTFKFLSSQLSIKTKVIKRREIYFIDHVKFQLDTIENLGYFVEIEVIDFEDKLKIEDMHETCNKYKSLLEIKPIDLISCSYSDLMMSDGSIVFNLEEHLLKLLKNNEKIMAGSTVKYLAKSIGDFELAKIILLKNYQLKEVNFSDNKQVFVFELTGLLKALKTKIKTLELSIASSDQNILRL